MDDPVGKTFSQLAFIAKSLAPLLIWRSLTSTLLAPVRRRGGELSSSPLGRHLRRAFPGMLIASGTYTPTSAIAAVESRWADAVAFTTTIGGSASLLVQIHDAALLP